MDERLPAHLEVAGLLRAVSQAGGFATVLKKGERDAGTILVVCAENGRSRRLYERMPSLDGPRIWSEIRCETSGIEADFDQYLNRRITQDSEVWIIELDIANGERFIGLTSV